jgi:hypothetical protein
VRQRVTTGDRNRSFFPFSLYPFPTEGDSIMRMWIPIALGAALLGYQAQRPAGSAPAPASAAEAAASTYEHLASAIIAIEATEDELVKSILIGHHTAAQAYLRAAATDAPSRTRHLEAAAAEVTNVANEGDKAIQAIRQRLAKAGHTHNTDVETKQDYMFITNREKKGLLDLASQIGHAGPDADLNALGASLSGAFAAAIAPE